MCVAQTPFLLLHMDLYSVYMAFYDMNMHSNARVFLCYRIYSPHRPKYLFGAVLSQ